MDLTLLPDEIIILIVTKLDTKSVKAMYETCSRFAKIVAMKNVIKECHFSLSTLANAKSLTSNFFLDVANHLKVLNLFAVQDLTKKLLLPAMKKLQNLYSLDVTYTAITIKDLLDIHKVCPTMKSIAINLSFTNTVQGSMVLSTCAISAYQNMFKHFENVHFVYDYTALCSHLIFTLLTKASLKSLIGTFTHVPFTRCIPKLEVQENCNITSDVCESLNLRFSYVREDRLEVISNIHFEKTEYLIFRYRDLKITHQFECHVVCTPLLQPFFRENFGIYAEDDENKMLRSHDNLIVVMFWRQDTTVFDDSFFSSLFKKIQSIVPINCMPVTPHSPYRKLIKNWIFLKCHKNIEDSQKSANDHLFKKRRLAPLSVALDCDDLCAGMQDIAMMVSFKLQRNPVTLATRSTYLKELTHLYLFDRVVYDSNFFNILFRICTKLKTKLIDVDLRKSNNSTSFSKSVPLSKSLKNLRMVSDSINFTTLFSYLSQCRSLEHIHIDETTISNNTITDLACPKLIFLNCPNLYNFTIYVRWPEKIFQNNLRMLKKVKAALGLHYLHVNMVRIEVGSSSHGYEYHPNTSYQYYLDTRTYNPVTSHHFLYRLNPFFNSNLQR